MQQKRKVEPSSTSQTYMKEIGREQAKNIPKHDAANFELSTRSFPVKTQLSMIKQCFYCGNFAGKVQKILR